MAAHLAMGVCGGDVASSVAGRVVKDPVQDKVVWREYLETVVKNAMGGKNLYRACREV